MLKLLEAPSPQPPDRSAPARLEYRYERLVSIAKELTPLGVRNWEGLPSRLKTHQLDVNWEQALLYDLNGYLHILTVRDTEVGNKLVGYIINQVVHPIMWTSTKWAIIEAIYLSEEYREGWTGYTMLKKNDKSMKELGVKIIKVFCPVGTFEPLLKRLGYEFLEVAGFKFL